MVDVGDTTIVSWALGEAGKTVVLTVTDPVGATSTPTVTEAQQGIYTASLTTALAGRYVLRWTTTGAAHSDIINVWPADPRFIISFAEAVAALRWREAEVEKYAEDLRLHIASATEVLEDIVGAVLVRTVIQTADGGEAGVMLTQRPETVTSVEVHGVRRRQGRGHRVRGRVRCDVPVGPADGAGHVHDRRLGCGAVDHRRGSYPRPPHGEG